MGNLMDLAGLAAVTVLSFALALGIEWLCLRGAILLLPNSRHRASAAVRKRTKAAEIRWAAARSRALPGGFRLELDR